MPGRRPPACRGALCMEDCREVERVDEPAQGERRAIVAPIPEDAEHLVGRLDQVAARIDEAAERFVARRGGSAVGRRSR